MLNKTSKSIKDSIRTGAHRFDARNNAQVYAGRDISKAYAEYFVLRKFCERFQRNDVSEDLRVVLKLLYSVYALSCLDKHMATFYIGGFAQTSSMADVVRQNLLQKCAILTSSAVSVADSIAPPDFALNSVIGRSDGNLYENLRNEFMTNQGAFERPSWWKDVIIPQVKSKL